MLPILQSQEQKIWLYSKSLFPVTLSHSNFKAPFEITSPQGSVTINPNDSLQISIKFNPQTCIKYSDTAIFYTSPCPDTALVIVKGEGDTKSTALLSVGTIRDTIKSDRKNPLPIPIVLRTADFLAPAGVTTFNTVMRFNSGMLLHKGLRVVNSKNNAKILYDKVVDGRRVLKLEFELNEMPMKDSIFAVLDVEPFLADSLETTIEFDSVNATNGCEITSVGSVGLYKLYPTDCLITNSRLFEYLTPLKIISVSPNPISNNVVIIVKHEPNEPFSLEYHEISGLQGSCIAESILDKKDETELRFDTKNMSSGVYRLVVTSNQGVATQTIVIEK